MIVDQSKIGLKKLQYIENDHIDICKAQRKRVILHRQNRKYSAS